MRAAVAGGMVLLLAVGMLFIAPGSGPAYEYLEEFPLTWADSSVSFGLVVSSLPESSMAPRVDDALAGWNEIGGADLDLSRFTSSCDPDDHYDLTPCIAMGEGILGDDVLGVTMVTWQQGEILDADIWLNGDLEWTDQNDLYMEAEPVNLQMVMMHELGHSIGLGHENDIVAVMNAYYPNGGQVGPDFDVIPLPDDRAGARSLYPAGDQETDLGASNYYRTGPDTSDYFRPVGSADPGSEVSFTYTVHNLGTTDQEDFSVAFYLSDDQAIDTSDRKIGEATGLSVDSGSSLTRSVDLLIPETIAIGTYYFGFIVDSGDTIEENNEDNNALAAASSTGIGLSDDDDDTGDDDQPPGRPNCPQICNLLEECGLLDELGIDPASCEDSCLHEFQRAMYDCLAVSEDCSQAEDCLEGDIERTVSEDDEDGCGCRL